jgi:hypothetical protein
MGPFVLTPVWVTCTKIYYHFEFGLALLILNTNLLTGIVEPIGACFESFGKLE